MAAAAAPKEPKYPQKLIKHLRELSIEKKDESKMFSEWSFSHTEDSEDASEKCPCGKKGIRYLCHIDNSTTRKKTFVGTSCVEFFDEDMKEVLRLVLGLISKGIVGTYKGKSGGTGRQKERFQVRKNTNLVKKVSRLKALFRYVPIREKHDGKWEIEVFTKEQGLVEGEKYEMKIKTSRWKQDYGTGISFWVIERNDVH